MKFLSFRDSVAWGGLKLAIVVNGVLFVFAIFTKSVALSNFIFSLAWFAVLIPSCILTYSLYRKLQGP